MDLIEASWKVTFNGVVLMDFTDYMSSEPKFANSQAGETVDLIGAAYGVQDQPSVGMTNTISFDVVKVYSTDALARAAIIAILAATPTGVHDATIAITDAISYKLEGARLLPYQPEMLEGSRVGIAYQLIGGALTLIV